MAARLFELFGLKLGKSDVAFSGDSRGSKGLIKTWSSLSALPLLKWGSVLLRSLEPQYYDIPYKEDDAK